MKVRGLNQFELNKAAQDTGVSIREMRPNGNYWQFVIKPEGGKYQRTSASYFNRGRKVNAVCWHGHRDFYRNIFKVNPNAVIRTALATYKGSDHFEHIYRDTDKNIGPPISPIHYSEACTCEDYDKTGDHLWTGGTYHD